jgi:hypothetical protein
MERTLLQKLRTGLELPLRKLDVTGSRSQAIKKLVAKGWIERGASNGSYRITPLGDAALRTPLPIIPRGSS